MQQLDAIVILTNQCNLNCAYCVYACDLNPPPYYITLDELKNTLFLMKQKLPSLKKLIFSGGDALMHPQFIEACELARQTFPALELCAYTNGLLLNKFTDEQIVYLTKTLRINIISSLYPSVKNLQHYKEQDARFKRAGTELYFQSSHFYFNKNNYKHHGLKFPKELVEKRFSECRTITKYNSLITIYRNKILTCCGEVGYLNCGKNADTSDLLDLTTLSSEQEILDFCERPHNICHDCASNEKLSNSQVLWQRKSRITSKHQERPLKLIFVRNYNDYKTLLLDNEEHLECLKDPFFTSKFLPDVNPGEVEQLQRKYINGLGDVFIPYDNTFLDEYKRQQLREKLLRVPNINNYNLYFVGIKTRPSCNDHMFRDFYGSRFSSHFNSTLLQSPSLIHGYEEFLHYSYLNKKILVDADVFIQSNSNTFEGM